MLGDGWFWMVFDDRKIPTEEKVKEHKRFCIKKFNVKPTVCLCHAVDESVTSIKMVADQYVSEHYFWFGVDDG